MRFQIARAARKTGSLLERLVREGLGEAHRAVVCYGVGYSGNLPALNAGCSSSNKLEQAVRLREELGVLAINPLSLYQALRQLPVLGRKDRHAKGKDIRLCLEAWQAEAVAPAVDFFVPYMPSVGEWRTWVYRKRHLGSYKKVLAHPEAMRRVGRNYDNGFRFQKVDRNEVPEALKELSRRAIAVLGLDFGAVDVLETTPGNFVVLEVNTAPGVQDERRAVINRLAQRVVRWAEEGYPNATA